MRNIMKNVYIKHIFIIFQNILENIEKGIISYMRGAGKW